MMPIRLTDSELQEVLQAARTVPFDLRQAFLEQLAIELHGKDLGDGVVHLTASRGRLRGTPNERRRPVRLARFASYVAAAAGGSPCPS